VPNLAKQRLLYTSGEIHGQIKRLFGQASPADRRVALVAYIGSDGSKYLPDPRGLRIICNPSAGGTDPDTLRELKARGASIEISDRLHMKVYWSKNRGCVITSANASSNALGRNALKEAGVSLPRGAVDINRLVRYANPRAIRESDFRKLDRETRELQRNSSAGRRTRKPAVDFPRWYGAPNRSVWKIAMFGKVVYGAAIAAKEQSRSEYGHKQPFDWASSSKKMSLRRSDWVLTLIEDDPDAASTSWLYVDFVVKIGSREHRYYHRDAPYHAVQVNSPSNYPPPPFRITTQFRKALKAVVGKYPIEAMSEAKAPPLRFLRRLEEEYRRIGISQRRH
jgi:hypothetical protein